ncbi:MAG: MGMT family protein [Candidatus Moraniibacteriota bacterium]|nr:MAG: MGMT family protein [Candidatus Moranbacteria bacterium]
MRAPTEESYKEGGNLSPFRRLVYRIVAQIPKGRVLTYGAVAARAGAPGAARAVGTAMAQNCYRDVPCHRVVRSDGSVGGYAFGGSRAKAARLRREGILLSCGRVVFSK